MPESFNVLVHELRGLGIKMEAFDDSVDENIDSERVDTKYQQDW
ncbi:Uncharacterised protein, partial [Metamycoplasma alkalescens]